ncbi:uncharacterized protein PF3D7_1120000-like [Onthophagus taurus]|uniref:uncharacterized protein PF3D7_1120000-like n=1 Tax=Onthophagus taurus TaxID=166361 RepID=UPI0039BE38BC
MENLPGEIFQKISMKRAELAKYKRILQLVDECALDPNLKNKVDYLIYSKEVSPSMKLNDDNVLGLSLKPENLPINEQQKLHRLVHSKLSKEPDLKHEEFNEDFNFTKPSKQESELLKLKLELDEIQKKYYENLIGYHKMLEEILKIRLNDSKDLINSKIEHSKLQFLSLELKVEILQQQIGTAVFTEESMAKHAYQKLLDEIVKQQIKVKNEIKELEELKEKYKSVSSKEFNDILKSYRFYKGELKKYEETMANIDSV